MGSKEDRMLKEERKQEHYIRMWYGGDMITFLLCLKQRRVVATAKSLLLLGHCSVVQLESQVIRILAVRASGLFTSDTFHQPWTI